MTSVSEITTDRLRLDLGERSYDILVGDGLLAQAGNAIAPLIGTQPSIIITEKTVAGFYLETLEKALTEAGIAYHTIVLPAGEQTKDFAHLEELANRLLDLKIERATTLIALGGGVIGDLTGFAAAVVLRGIPFIQIPTTLLAQVDSSVGGKTGINTRQGKNLIGAFYQPQLVLADTSVLDTLPPRDLGAGYAEVVKYGLIGDAGFFDWLEANGPAIFKGDSAARRHAVVTSCAAKAEIVAVDEREAGRRALLNFGHTFGHALEAETGFGTDLLHGEAVAIGMILAFDISTRLGLCPAPDAARVRRHFTAVGLPTSFGGLAHSDWTADRLIALMAQDKKVRDGTMTFILAHGIGKAFISQDVSTDILRDLLTDALAA
jgi:3-dehydroquinate synthase